MHHHKTFYQEETPVNIYDLDLVKRLLMLARPHTGTLVLCLLMVLFITGVTLARPYVIKLAIDDVLLADGTMGELLQLGLIYLFLALLTVVLQYFQFFLLQKTGQTIIYHLRRKLFRHLLGFNMRYFDSNPTGRLVTRVTNDTETINEVYTSLLVNLFRDTFLLGGTIIVMLSMHTGLALLSFSVIPLVFAATLLYRRAARSAYREVRRHLARINSFLSENIAGMNLVQVFRGEGKQMDEFASINQDHFQASMKEVKAFALFRPSMDLIRSLALILLLWFGGNAVLEEAIPFGVLFAFVNYLDHFFRPINDLTEKYSILQSAMASAERIFHLLDEQEKPAQPEKKSFLSAPRGEITLKNVWFAYKEPEWVLKDVSLHINEGEKIALMGVTGAGKTSLAQLLNRFYEPQHGEILLDGLNIKAIPLHELRSQMGIVQQDVFLFNGSVAENIALFNPALHLAKIKEAAQKTGAHDFITRLPQGYHTNLGERGASLSTGQRQLLAFARILVYEPAVFILDEATAHVDLYTERLLQKALLKAAENRTTIIIAHRPATIRIAQRYFTIQQNQLA